MALLTALAQLLIGTEVSPADALQVLLGRSEEPVAQSIVRGIRVPRTLIALAAGGCMGASGLLLQAALRNPLAAPELTGVSAGAVLGVVAALTAGLTDTTAPLGTAIAAAGGGMIGAALLRAAAGRRSDPANLAVLGVVVAAALSGVTALLISTDPAAVGGAFRWLVGSLNARTWPHWALLWPWTVVAVAATYAAAAAVTLLSTGDDQARSLGLGPDGMRAIAIALAVALASGAVAIVGAVAFVGLVVPHMAVTLVGADVRRSLPVAVIGGGVALSAADAIAQLVTRLAPQMGTGGAFALPVGAVTSVLGAMVLLTIARRRDVAAATTPRRRLLTRSAPRREDSRVSADDQGGPEEAVRVERVSLSYGETPVLRGVDLAIAQGELVALVGVNGCGKSTLLRVCAGALDADDGTVHVAGRDLRSFSGRALAREVAVLHQHAPPVPGLTVRQLVRQGRYPHRGPLRMLVDTEDTHCADAMVATGVVHMADREIDGLSGGERQRARLALALAQDTPTIFLDEPTSYLDVRHQLEVLELVRHIHQEHGRTIVMVLHDLAQAARFADRVVVLDQGRVVADGPWAAVLTPSLMSGVFGVDADVMIDSSALPVFSYRRQRDADVERTVG